MKKRDFQNTISKISQNKYTPPFVLLLLGLVSRFAFIWHPPQVVFDEVHFGKFVSAYLTGEYFFDIHPPLGKLLIAFAAFVSGFRPGFDFKVIGETYTTSSYIIMRFFPNFFGALLPVCIFFFVRALRGSRTAAFFAGITLVFDNAILVQSHFILMDSMLLFFGFLGLALFFWYRNYSNKLVHLFGAGIFLAFSASVKWTGLFLLGITYFVCLWDLVGQKVIAKTYIVKETILRCAMLLLVPFFIYVSIFSVHFSLLNKSGTGDAFMSPPFLKTLQNSPLRFNDSIKPLNFWEKFFELNGKLYSVNASFSQTHPYSSKFYTWPVMSRPIYFWVKETSSNLTSRIYLLGNPFIWWIAFGSMIAGVIYWKTPTPETKWFLYFGWYLNFFPFFIIKRIMFLYHYFPALIFSIVIMSLFFFDSFKNLKRYRIILLVALISLFVIGFIFFSPLTYGFPLNSEQYNLRIWFKGWT